jgi:hypothetical protein
LKRQYKGDPDLTKIEKRGKVGEQDDSDSDDADFNKYMPQEFLKRLPGMDDLKVKVFIKKAKTLGIRTIVDICNADLEKLSEIVGQKKAKELKSFLERKIEFKDLKI